MSRDAAGSHEPEHGLARGVIAFALVAFEPFGLHGDDRDAVFLLGLFADRLQIVADYPYDAGGIDEGRSGFVALDEFGQGSGEFGFAAEDDVAFL